MNVLDQAGNVVATVTTLASGAVTLSLSNTVSVSPIALDQSTALALAVALISPYIAETASSSEPV